jgi:hypothetical protein
MEEMSIDDPDKNPVLFLEVNLAPGSIKKLVVYEGEDPI